MAKYYVSRSKTGRNAQPNETPDEGPFNERGQALHWARQNSKGFKVVTILRDSEGWDHPDNAGKRFLDAIVK